MESSLENLWTQVLDRLQVQLSRPTFDTWIKSATAEHLEGQRLVLCTPNPFARNWIQKYYIQKIAEVAQEVFGYPVEIQINIAQNGGMTETEVDTFWLPSIESSFTALPPIPTPAVTDQLALPRTQLQIRVLTFGRWLQQPDGPRCFSGRSGVARARV